MANQEVQADPARLRGLAKRVLVIFAVLVLCFAVLAALWLAKHVVLLTFGGVLFALFLRGLGDQLSAHTNLSQRAALAIVVVVLFGITVFGVWRLAPQVGRQVEEMSERLPAAVSQIEDRLDDTAWGRQLVRYAKGSADVTRASGDTVGRITGVFSVAGDVFVALLLVLFVGIYVAFDPKLYLRGVVKLVPESHRQHARYVLATLGKNLQWWLLGQVTSMAVIGVLTTIALWILGIPLALTLGLIAALLSFIPNIGPTIAVIPAALIALVDSPKKALYVIAAYLIVQAIETYLITPFVQRKAISMPQALLLSSQIFLGVIFGAAGLILAAPLTAVMILLVKMLYIERGLGEDVSIPHEPEALRPSANPSQ